MIRLAVAGEQGRMASVLLQLINAAPDLALTGTVTRGDGIPEKTQVLIDFTEAENSCTLAAVCAARGIAHIIGTTGFSAAQIQAIDAAAAKTVIVRSGNMSLGVNLLLSLVAQAAKILPPEFDIEILETHHRAKKDAPSGTALMLGEAAAKARGETHTESSDRNGERGTGIGYASLRGGSVVGEHDVIFAGPSERLVLSHKADDRAVFARGALAAAKWAVQQKPGLYTMQDVLGHKQ